MMGGTDKDGDGKANREKLLVVAPNWRPVLNKDGSAKEGRA
jgi:hypothetical protein